jgi:hypothetical protein
VRILVLYGRAEKNCFLYITRGPRYRKKWESSYFTAGPGKIAFCTLWKGPAKWTSENPRTSRQGQEKLFFVHYGKAQINEKLLFIHYGRAQINAKVRILVWPWHIAFCTVPRVSNKLKCENSRKMVESLGEKCKAEGIPFSAKDARMRCMPHTVHLAALQVEETTISSTFATYTNLNIIKSFLKGLVSSPPQRKKKRHMLACTRNRPLRLWTANMTMRMPALKIKIMWQKMAQVCLRFCQQ